MINKHHERVKTMMHEIMMMFVECAAFISEVFWAIVGNPAIFFKLAAASTGFVLFLVFMTALVLIGLYAMRVMTMNKKIEADYAKQRIIDQQNALIQQMADQMMKMR